MRGNMTKVKICGLTRLADIEAVNASLPDFIGFVFCKSRRRVSEETARLLKSRLNPKISAVGVFQNAEIHEVASIVKSGIIDIVQLHGLEDEHYIHALKPHIGQAKIIKAVCFNRETPCNHCLADFLLFDSAYGGSGKTFDWKALPKTEKPFFVAGGLTVDNVENAISQVKPYAVDVSSGVETDGLKDAEKIADFVRIVRQTDN